MTRPNAKTLSVSAAAVAATLLAAAVLGSTLSAQAQPEPPPLRFGMPVNAIHDVAEAGAPADYGTFWIGPWTLKHGWGGPDRHLDDLYAAGVAPAIHYYYWGDDITPDCVENGCWSSLHGAQKDRAGWDRLGQELTDHLNARMKGRPVVVMLETEFNKGGIQTYEPFDGYLAEKAASIKAAYPAAEVVLPFGNWGRNYWGNFDRAAAASDLIGIQGMRGSTRDSLTSYYGLPEAMVDGASYARSLFGKDVLITDVALSTYPEPEYLDHQNTVLKTLLDKRAELKAHGVVGLIYRTLRNHDNMDLNNYYGQAERHWGLHYSDSTPKPSWTTWMDAVKAERAGDSSPTFSGIPVAGGATVRTEAEAFQTRSGGGTQNDAGASGGKFWHQWSNGAITQQYAFEVPGDWTLRVDARGHELDGVAPHMEVRVNGDLVLVADPPAGPWASFEAPVSIAKAGSATVEVRFTNDGRTSTGDRNLLVDHVEWSPDPRAPARVEAEAFQTRSSGGTQPDASASAGARWNQWSNGAIAHPLQVSTTGHHTVTVMARGQELGGVGPVMEVRIDGTLALRTTPPTEWTAFPVPVDLGAGTRTIEIRYTNDARTSTEDRNLLVDYVEIAPASAPANRAPTASFAHASDALTVSVDASESSDPDNDALTYAWDWGDGATGAGATATHTYRAGDTYRVTLTVSDGEETATKEAAITVAPAAPRLDVTEGVSVQTSGAQATVRFSVANPDAAPVDATAIGIEITGPQRRTSTDWDVQVARGDPYTYQSAHWLVPGTYTVRAVAQTADGPVTLRLADGTQAERTFTV